MSSRLKFQRLSREFVFRGQVDADDLADIIAWFEAQGFVPRSNDPPQIAHRHTFWLPVNHKGQLCNFQFHMVQNQTWVLIDNPRLCPMSLRVHHATAYVGYSNTLPADWSDEHPHDDLIIKATPLMQYWTSLHVEARYRKRHAPQAAIARLYLC